MILQVSEWLISKDLGDCVLQLDLIGIIHGVESAEAYFNSVIDTDVEEKGRLYSCLMYCYVRERLVDKTLSLMQRMKDLGFVDTLAYNNIMTLYKNVNQADKIPDVLSEMRKDGIVPDKGTYRLCIDAYGLRSDFDNMEKMLEELESRRKIPDEWGSYAVVAKFYIKAGDHEKASIHLKKCEELVGKDSAGYNLLISNYAKLGRKDEMKRLWGIQKAICKKQSNKDYVTIIGARVKLEDFEEAEKLLREWESSCQLYHFWVPNTFLTGYCKKGLTKKAESMLCEIIAKGKTPIPDSWSIIAAGYVDEKKMEKALECMKKALALQTETTEWKAKPDLVMSILNWLADSKDVEEVEAFVESAKNVIPVGREMYHALIKGYVRNGKEVDGVLKRMKSDGIDVDEDTQKILKAQAA